MKQVRRLISIATAVTLMALSCLGRASPDKKAHMFHGKVEEVDKDAKNLTVIGAKVEGWMDAMTMNYKVDDPSILEKVKPCDQIMASVYDGDYSLHKVQIIGKSAADSKSKQ